MTVKEWLAAARRTVSDPCWCCGLLQTREGFVGYSMPMYCPSCSVSWVVKVERN